MSIDVANLTKIYGGQKAVNNISFKVNKGEIVGFLGPNGAGKSTTMKIITGYLPANAGAATVCGINVKENPIEVKQKIGYLPESNPLYFDMYVKEYLKFVCSIFQVSNFKFQISKVIELTGLQVEQKKKIGQLSKGYKQRVGLAAALIHNPEVLILDEPTGGLDPNQIVEIRNVIKQQGQDKTVLFSSHILQEVQAICDRIIIINKGEIVVDDTLNNIQHSQKKQNTLLVEFKNISNQQLKQIELNPLVQSLSVNQHQLSIQTVQPELLKKEILEFSLQQNLNIISLQTQTQSLEDVFRSLTINS